VCCDIDQIGGIERLPDRRHRLDKLQNLGDRAKSEILQKLF
jgi:hypothetical protein